MAETLQQQTEQRPENIAVEPVFIVGVEKDAQIDVQQRAAEIVSNELEIVANNAEIKPEKFSEDLAKYTPVEKHRLRIAARWVLDRHPGTVEAANLYKSNNR